MKTLPSLLAACALLTGVYDTAIAGNAPENFIYTSSGDLPSAGALLGRPDIGGVQIVYNWRKLETGIL